MAFTVRKRFHDNGYYISNGGCGADNYLYKDFTTHSMMKLEEYFSTRKEAEEFLKRFDCSHSGVGKANSGFYAYTENSGNYYIHRDGSIQSGTFGKGGSGGYFETKAEAEKALKEKKREMCDGHSDAVVNNEKIHLTLEGEIVPQIQQIEARLVSDHSGERIVLQVRTPSLPFFIGVARLVVKDGKVAMFREQGLESKFINTDSQGRIQN